jgi:catechol 2,3-dioxygenase-like lactoylglutathione lyase family enzyme
MKYRIVLLIGAWAAVGVFMLAAAERREQEEKVEFSRTTADLGVVAANIEKTTQFYTQALGFTKVSKFEVSDQMAGNTGLTDFKPFQVHVFALSKEPSATRLKIMQIPGDGSKTVDNRYIGSSLGFRYLTLHVSDLTKAMERLKRNGVSPAKPPYRLPTGEHLILVRDPDGNLIELIGPRP